MSKETTKASTKETKDLSLYTKINFIFNRKQKFQLVMLGVLILIGGVFETIGVSAILPVVNTVLDPESLGRYIGKVPGLSEQLTAMGFDTNTKLICLMLTGLIILYILKNVYLLFLTYRQNAFVAVAKNDMISRVLADFLNKPYEEYLSADIPTVFRITDSDIPHLFQMMLSLLSLATELVVSTFIGIVLLIINPPMTIMIVVVLGVLTFISTKLLKPRLNKVGEKNLHVQSRIAKWRLQAIYGLKDVKVLNRQDFFIRNYYESGKSGADLTIQYSVMNNIPRLLIETIFMSAVFIYIMIYVTTQGDVKTLVPQLAAFGIAAVRIMPSANRINTYITQIAYYQPSVDYLYDNLTASNKMEKEMRAKRAEIAGPALHMEKEIELRNITFRYPDGDKNIFTDAGMIVKKGQSVGIMGPSGAGKSTVVDVLLGLLKVSKGDILCDGVNVFTNYESWLAQIGYIPQQIYLNDESIRDNIAFGIDEEEIDDERIWAVCREAQLEDFIKTLPEGLDTKIGDRGVRLSGGQRQRIGIARALYHNPEILVFDEATSALDNETEKAVMEAINSFHGKKTMIIIAHRLNTIEKCDKIYEVKDETIKETSLEGRNVIH